MKTGLMRTLYKEFLFTVLDDTNGIETYDLLNGLRNRLMPDMSGHSEIFQLVVHKADVIITELFVEVE